MSHVRRVTEGVVVVCRVVVVSPNGRGGWTPLRPLRGLQETRVATREESGVLGPLLIFSILPSVVTSHVIMAALLSLPAPLSLRGPLKVL